METALTGRAARYATGLLLAAVAFVGIAQLAFLPPWEGFDETAHWSYIQELSDKGRPPRYGIDGLSADVAAYPGPMPYRSEAPFDKTGRPTYRSYRRAGSNPLRGGPTQYVSTADLNWQAQHPPLYYLLMVPIYRASKAFGWVDNLLALRLASFLLAFIGLAIGVLSTAKARLRAGTTSATWTAPIMAAWPFFVPQFFPQFARLGNDSLCLLIMGLVWALLLRLLERRTPVLSVAGLGACLGLGLLTKAFFLPISASVVFILLIDGWLSNRRWAALREVVVLAATAFAIGGWWYMAKYAETGSLTGSDEFIRLGKAGGASLLADGFSAQEFLQGLSVIGGTFIWAGTWSEPSLPIIFILCPLAFLAITLFHSMRRLKRDEVLGWAPVIFAGPLLAGLIYHVFVWMAGSGATTPGWYFHILAAPLGFAVARGWAQRRVLALLTGAAVVFTAIAWTLQLSMFSGCAGKIGDNPGYTLAGAHCFLDYRAIAVLSHPWLGFSSLAIGAALAGVAAYLAIRANRSKMPT